MVAMAMAVLVDRRHADLLRPHVQDFLPGTWCYSARRYTPTAEAKPQRASTTDSLTKSITARASGPMTRRDTVSPCRTVCVDCLCVEVCEECGPAGKGGRSVVESHISSP